MFQMQYLQVSFEAACFSEHFDTALKKKNWFKNDVVPAQKKKQKQNKRPKQKQKTKLFWGGGKREILRKMVFLKLLSVQSLSRPFLCPGM